MTQPTATLGYVAQSYPNLTQTFVYREVLALERKGFNIATFAIWKPDRDKLSQEARHLVDATSYVFPLSWGAFLRTHFYFLINRPGKYFGTAFFVLTRRGESIKNRLRTLFHFAEAVYLAREMERLKIKHIHAHFAINAASIALVVSRLLDISFSFTAHNIFFIDRILLKEKVREARFIAAISEFSRRFLLDLVPGEDVGEKIHVVHCGVSPEDFAPPNPRVENDIPRLLFVAQLVERKGAPVLVEACKILMDRGLKFRCVIIGDGPQRALLEQLVERYALQEVVELKGAVFQEDLKAYLDRANAFVLPCIRASNGDMDGVPVSLMEAMAMEIPTVSTRVSGIPELIEDAESGLLVAEKDELALANALQRLIEDKALRVKLGENGRLKVIREFNNHESATQLATLFANYLNEYPVKDDLR